MMLSSLTEPRQTPPLSLSPQAPLPAHPSAFPSLTAATAAAAAAAAAAAEAMTTSNPTSPLSSPHLPTSATDLSRQDLYLSSPVDSVRSSPPAPSPAPPALGSPKSVGMTLPRQNQVGTVLLHGEYIVSLMIDNKERLCLAQISNTLLKDFSYNEIHNRRVALGITCVQCTPVQLEILRRAGAMPISSRRCGMISKREAERLVRSFLEDSEPPKLPETFAFNVMHSCGWGCSGQFLPSRYNSSRAKCIKCDDCQMFFSPNKFIFHFHRTPDAKYHHPDAANFNSWRRHLRLHYDNPTDELVHVWEDVKAMFNGGSRKRLVSHGNGSGGSGSNHKSSHHGGGSGGGVGGGGSRNSAENSKRARLNPQDGSAMMNKMATGLPYPYPVMPMAPSNACSNMAVAAAGAYMSRAPHPAFPFPSPDPSMFHMDTSKAAPTNMAEFWKTKNAAAATAPYVHPFNYFWAKNLALYNDNSTPYRNVLDFSRQTTGGKQLPDPVMTGSEKMASPPSSSLTPRSHHHPHSSPPLPPPAHEPPTKEEVDKYFSAFKPVAVRENNNKLSAFDDKLQLPEDRNWMSHDHSDASDMSAVGDDVSNDVSSIADADDTDINVTDVEHVDQHDFREALTPPSVIDTKHPYDDEVRDSHVTSRIDDVTNQNDVTENDRQSSTSPQLKSENKDEESRVDGDETVVRRPWADSDRIYNMSREELQSELRTMMEERRKAEVDYISMSANYEEKRKRNGELRDGLERQLHMVKGDICQEVEDERVSQQLMQNKLKEARDALQQFSHKMSALRGCIDCN